MKVNYFQLFVLIFLSSIFNSNAQVKAYSAGIVKGPQVCVDLRSVDNIVIAHQKNVSVDYYAGFNSALNQTNPLKRLHSYSHNKTVFARVTSDLNSDFAISEIELTIIEGTPPLGIFVYNVCDVGNDGFEIINLNNLDLNGTLGAGTTLCNSLDSDIAMSYYLTQDDAMNVVNPVFSSAFTVSSNTDFYYRLENVNTNEYVTELFKVNFVSCSNDDTDGDGITDESEDTNYNFRNDEDTDQDGILNFMDDDDDGDGILTINEDANNNGDPTDDDTNGNGVPDYLDGPATINMPIVNIPDANFKATLLYSKCAYIDVDNLPENVPDTYVDTNHDGEIQVSEAEAVIGLNVSGYSISDLTGIEAFINIEDLFINGINLNNINISQNLKLKNLYCARNNFMSLDISQNLKLTKLICTGNNLTSLDVSNNNLLEIIECSENQLTSIDLSNAPNLWDLRIFNNQLTDLDVSNNNELVQLWTEHNELTSINLGSLPKLYNLFIAHNQLTSLNVSGLQNVYEIWCDFNQLTEIDLNQNINLVELYCTNNMLTVLDLSNNPLLTDLICQYNQITTLDFSNNPNFLRIEFDNNMPLEWINIKNGSPFLPGDFTFQNNPNLHYICTDSEKITEAKQAVLSNGYLADNIVVNSFCSFVPGGEFFTIQGKSYLDINSDGCDVTDPIFPDVKFNISNDTDGQEIISDVSGNYRITVQADSYTVTPIIENSDYFSIVPNNIVVEFPAENSPYIQDFCISPIGTFSDLEVILIPVDVARPGFDANYKIVYKNKGNTIESGSVEVGYDDDLIDFISSVPMVDNQNVGIISWNFSNLLPLETREIEFVMNLNTPTDPSFPLNGGDIIVFDTAINEFADDETPDDNVFTLNQEVVNSFDPNDKTCLEGNTITLDLVGEYVHYLIRCENTGTAEAVNIVIKDVIDTTKFDISTLFITDSSHDMVTRINDNVVEFIFENINLPFDDANNDGYVAFKIKTLPTLQVGDAFENEAEIYFDFNFPIETNVALTSIENALGVEGFEISNNLKVYPNPVNAKLTIETKGIIKSIAVYNVSGSLIHQVSYIGTKNNIEIPTKNLSQGTYFIKVSTDLGLAYKKLIKK